MNIVRREVVKGKGASFKDIHSPFWKPTGILEDVPHVLTSVI